MRGINGVPTSLDITDKDFMLCGVMNYFGD